LRGFETEEKVLEERKRLEGNVYNIILNSPIENPNDLVLIIHATYAWMPKMNQQSSVNNFIKTDMKKLTPSRFSCKRRSNLPPMMKIFCLKAWQT
jgi:hypothetical protein